MHPNGFFLSFSFLVVWDKVVDISFIGGNRDGMTEHINTTLIVMKWLKTPVYIRINQSSDGYIGRDKSSIIC